MSTDATVSGSSSLKEQAEMDTKMDTSTNDVENTNQPESSANDVDETAAETKSGKRKRSAKKPAATEESTTTNTRPRRTLPKREEPSAAAALNGAGRASKTKTQNSAEQAATDADDEQEREKNIPVAHDVADVVWVKIGGHPWWPSLIIRDPNDPTRSFTKVSGNTRAKRLYFVVFYGSTADFAWVADAAIIPYQGVEAFTKYAQEIVDKAQTKSQKEQLTERFQLKVTIGRREDWEMAVREADDAIKQTSETRLGEIDPKIKFYTSKITTNKGQTSRKSKGGANKSDEASESSPAAVSSMDQADRSTLAEKTFEFKSEDEVSDEEIRVRKTPSVKIKLKKQVSNDADATTTPPAKRRNARSSAAPSTSTAAAGQTENGSAVTFQQETSPSANDSSLANGSSPGKKRGRPPRLSKPSVIATNGEAESSAQSKSVTPKTKPTITKPQAFMNTSQPVSSLDSILSTPHHRFETRIGFLTPFEEQEIVDSLEHLRSKTFEEAEQIAKQRFEQILSLNLNKTKVDIPQEWFCSFLFAHPILIVKNPHWFDAKKTSDSLIDNDLLNNVNCTQSTSSLQVLKHQLSILSKLYRNELQVRQTAADSTN